MILLLKQKEEQIIKERDELLQKLELTYMNYVQRVLHQKSFITRKIREQYDECLNNVNNLIYNTINNTINNNQNALISNINNLINIPPNPQPPQLLNKDAFLLTTLGIPKQQPLSDQTNNKSSFISHMCLEDAMKLSINDKIDHRDIAGAFYPATIQEKDGTKLKIHYMNWNSEWDVFSDPTKELCKFAKYKSISSRSKHRLFNLQVGDKVDINPILDDKKQGWLIGKIIEFDEKSAQVKISYNLDGGIWENYFWTHLDNDQEIDELYTHTPINGSTPYICLYCKCSFMTNDKLRQHIKLDHTSRPHLCEYCPQSFHAKNGLDTHLKQHLKNKNCQFKCNVCKKLFGSFTAFKFKHILTSHLSRVHKISGQTSVVVGQKRKHNRNEIEKQSKKAKHNENNNQISKDQNKK